MKDYYKILEVEENSTDEEIKKSYRTLSKKYHPDVNPNGTEKFKEINEAYEILGDKQKRNNYNNSKNNPYANTPFQDIFNSMFGGSPADFVKQHRTKSAPDKLIKVQISPIDSYKGIEKVIYYMKDTHCNVCVGSGGEQQTCQTCNGAGFEIKTMGNGFMVQHIRTSCSTCGGKGYTLVHKCYGCDGRGVKSSSHEVKVKLPVGVDNGQYLKLQGLGDFRNGQYGDLVVQVEVVNKDGFEKLNNDLIYNLYLNLEEVQKDKFLIPHPDGTLSMDSPRLFDTSRPLRLKGKGYNGGDMYVKLNVRFEKVI
jgi:molecular chaperone DnaJ